MDAGYVKDDAGKVVVADKLLEVWRAHYEKL